MERLKCALTDKYMNAKQDYLVRELWILAWNASVQHADLYRKGIKPGSEDARVFRRDLIGHLSSQVIPRYSKDGINEEQHYQHIDDLIAYANNAGEKVLGLLGYKYGIAQKLLNLVLKYHWCLGAVMEPPHCPVDRIVIDKTSYKGKINWTEIVRRSQYQSIIEDIRLRAGNHSIAMWELSNYSRR
jgi:hypothetical protein